MSDDDDVSVIALSDDEGATTAKPSQSKPAPQRAVSFVPEASIRGSTAKAKSSSTPSANQRAGDSSSSGKQGKGHGGRAKAVEPVYEDDEEQDDSGRGGAAGHYDEDDEEEEAGGGGGGSYRQGGGGGGRSWTSRVWTTSPTALPAAKMSMTPAPAPGSRWTRRRSERWEDRAHCSTHAWGACLHRAYAWVICHAGPVHGCMGSWAIAWAMQGVCMA